MPRQMIHCVNMIGQVGQSLITATPQQSAGCRQQKFLTCKNWNVITAWTKLNLEIAETSSKVTEEEISAARSGEQVLAKGGFAVALTRQPVAVCKPHQQRKKESFLQGKGEGKFRFMQQKQPRSSRSNREKPGF